jgi:tetratricopeptide (TPR) repeat protein
MRSYFFIIILLVSAAFFSACSKPADGNNANSVANTNANAAPSVPQYPDAQTAFDEGTKFFDAGKESQAIEALKQAVAFNPDMAEAQFKLGMAYSILDKETDAAAAFEAAVEAYKKILKSSPDNAQAQFDLGRSYNKLNKDKEAEEALRKAVRLNGEDSSYQTEMGAILIKLAKYSEAIGFLKKALDIDPDNARATDLMERAQEGKVRVEQGVPAGANSNRSAVGNRAANANSNTETNTDKPANTPPPPANKKPEPKPTVITIGPAKPAAKPPERRP